MDRCSYFCRMNIAVIGSGWLGLPLAEKLRVEGHSVFSTKRTLTPDSGEHILLFPSPDGSTEKLLSVVHAIVLAFPPSRISAEAYRNDCVAVVKLLSPDCRVVMISSTGVYANTIETAVETVPDNGNGENRIALAEKALFDELGNRLTIVRLAGLMGPGRYPASAMSRSGKTYAGNEPVNVIHLEDAVGLPAYLIQQGLWGEIVNGCAQKHPSKKVFYSRMAEKLGITAPHFDDEKASGKIVSSEQSRKLGYRYVYDDPMDFMND